MPTDTECKSMKCDNSNVLISTKLNLLNCDLKFLKLISQLNRQCMNLLVLNFDWTKPNQAQDLSKDPDLFILGHPV